MKIKIPFFSSFFHYFRVFWGLAGYRFPVYVLLSFFASFTESIGLLMVIPLLSLVNADHSRSGKVYALVEQLFGKINLTVSINTVLLVICIVFAIKAVIFFLQNLFRFVIKSTILRKWKMKAITLLENLDYQFFLTTDFGTYVNLVTKESDRAIGAFISFCLVVTLFLSVLNYLIFAVLLSWKVSLCGMVAGGLMSFILRWTHPLIESWSLRSTRQNAKLHQTIIQSVQNYKYLSSTGAFDLFRKKLQRVIDETVRLEFLEGSVQWSIRSVLEMLAVWMVVGLIFFQVSILGKTLESVIVVAIFFNRILMIFNSMQISWAGFMESIGGLHEMERICGEMERHQEVNGAIQKKEFSNRISFRNVDFHYQQKKILSNVNLEIQKNTSVAFVGETGAGKTTLVNLITGLLTPSQGAIFLDGIPYKEIDLRRFRKKIGYVTQENVVFNDSLKNNLTLWNEEIDVGSLQTIIQKVKLSALLTNRSEVLNAEVGDMGIKLSGGERQRLSLARELCKDASLLILDEATSALDAETERFIQNSLMELNHKQTVIVIAHRLSTIRNCDKIYVLDSGTIKESGSFEELYGAQDSFFRKMCNLQGITKEAIYD